MTNFLFTKTKTFLACSAIDPFIRGKASRDIIFSPESNYNEDEILYVACLPHWEIGRTFQKEWDMFGI